LETLIVVAVTGAVGIAALMGSIAWPLFIKPKLRRHYERKHHRAKANARREAGSDRGG
jgi:hypothetical protein